MSPELNKIVLGRAHSRMAERENEKFSHKSAENEGSYYSIPEVLINFYRTEGI